MPEKGNLKRMLRGAYFLQRKDDHGRTCPGAGRWADIFRPENYHIVVFTGEGFPGNFIQ